MSKEKSPAKSSSRQHTAPAIKSDKHPMFPSIKAKGESLYSKSTSDGSKPNLTKRK